MLLTRRNQLGTAIESVEGVQETLVVGDLIRALNHSSTPTIEMLEREFMTFDISNYNPLSGRDGGTVTFDTEVKGSGTVDVAPEWGKLLLACGFEETITGSTSVVYSPISSSIPSLTIGNYMDGTRNIMRGCRGSAVMNFTVGQIPKITWTFTTAGFSVADVGLFTSGFTYDTTIPPIVLGATFTLDSEVFIVSNVSIDLGNELSLRDSIVASSGTLSVMVGARKPVLSMDPEMELVADYDFFGKWKSGAEGALSLAIGGTAGNIITVTAPKVRYTNLAHTERGILRTLGVDASLNRNAGDDELIITLT